MKTLLQNVIRSLNWVEIEVGKCYTDRAWYVQAQHQNILLFPSILSSWTSVHSFHSNEIDFLSILWRIYSISWLAWISWNSHTVIWKISFNFGKSLCLKSEYMFKWHMILYFIFWVEIVLIGFWASVTVGSLHID